MTISYTLKVANARFGGFSKLLFRWKGSIYKLLYKEFLVFVSLYTLFSATYRLLLREDQKRGFEDVALYCNKYTDLIPISFLLGFYVNLIISRWWGQYTNIPLPDQLMCVVSSNVHGADEKGRLLRRTLIRYANLSSVLILRSVSTRVLKRFPTMEHIVEAGFMTHEELKKYDSLSSEFNKYWIPCVWFTNMASQARRDGRVRDDVALKLLMDELNKYRAKCSMLFHYDWISVPLVYTQVVTIAVYSFFAFCLIGRQFLDPAQKLTGHSMDMYVPVFTLLQFFSYFGWLKVAEQIINPFGEDDDDFETNRLIDRNLQVSLLSVDEMYQNLPPMLKDKYWDDQNAAPPYTIATAAETLKPSFMGSAFDMRYVGDSEQVPYTPSMPRARTPLLGRFLSSAASPGVSMKNIMGRGARGPLVRFKGEGHASPNQNAHHSDQDQDYVQRIEEEETTEDEKESRGSEPPTPRLLLKGQRRLQASEKQKKMQQQPKPSLLLITVDEPSDEDSEQAEC